MNTRRQFFQKLALGAAAFAILPGAKTYERIWKPKRTIYVLNPDYVNAEWAMDIVWHPKALDIKTRSAAVLIPERRFRFHDGWMVDVPNYIEVVES